MASKKLREALYAALKSYHQSEADTAPFENMLIFQQARRQSSSDRETVNILLIESLKSLSVKQQEAARLLEKRFIDGESILAVTRSLNVSDRTLQRKQKEALKQLALIAQAKEDQAVSRQQSVWEGRLEQLPYIELIGIEEHLDRLLARLSASGPPWLVAIGGIGGIGKTSLADAVSRRVIRERLFDDFGWVSARQHTLYLEGGFIEPVNRPALSVEELVERLSGQLMAGTPRAADLSYQDTLAALRARLKQRAHLIVIDNLETVSDLKQLLPTLRRLSNPSRFLLTSRKSLHYEPGLFHFPLSELSEANAIRLIRYEAGLSNSYLAGMEDDTLKKIVAIVGGNPLALRLAVGQTQVFPLEVILKDLSAARGRRIESLYAFIYRRAWDSLDKVTQQVFMAMPLMAEGEGDPDHLAEVSNVSGDELRDALARLVSLNLVDSRGNAAERYYAIHNLTRTFLEELIFDKWQET